MISYSVKLLNIFVGRLSDAARHYRIHTNDRLERLNTYKETKKKITFLIGQTVPMSRTLLWQALYTGNILPKPNNGLLLLLLFINK